MGSAELVLNLTPLLDENVDGGETTLAPDAGEEVGVGEGCVEACAMDETTADVTDGIEQGPVLERLGVMLDGDGALGVHGCGAGDWRGTGGAGGAGARLGDCGGCWWVGRLGQWRGIHVFGEWRSEKAENGRN